ncbi:MAG TPA: M23 family metallopeptidase [Gammaproteobacteria bacterium]
MNILLISNRLGCSGCINLSRRTLIMVATGIFLAMPLVSGYVGYRWASEGGAADGTLASRMQAELTQQRQEIEEAKRTAEENLAALTVRLGQMQAHVIRLDALGQRLTKMAKLDNGEFDFGNPPAQGGPETGEGAAMQLPDFLSQLDALSTQLNDRSQQLSVLETVLLNQAVQAEVVPNGVPSDSGFISSHFGLRNDPFTGRIAMHKGVDLAGKEGSEVVSVAAGVVTWSGNRLGYGNMVEVTHGNGYVTRYGHNEKNLVKMGEMIKKGQPIALMGSTGRSTGPHVHFEVYFNGQVVDPMKYIRASNDWK